MYSLKYQDLTVSYLLEAILSTVNSRYLDFGYLE